MGPETLDKLDHPIHVDSEPLHERLRIVVEVVFKAHVPTDIQPVLEIDDSVCFRFFHVLEGLFRIQHLRVDATLKLKDDLIGEMSDIFRHCAFSS